MLFGYEILRTLMIIEEMLFFAVAFTDCVKTNVNKKIE
jgi:hypothetical protein